MQVGNLGKAPIVGDIVIFSPGDNQQPIRLVIESRGIEILVMTPGWPNRWVRRDAVRIVNEDS
jgi:hypothetical protein